MADLSLHAGDLVHRAASWADLPDDELKRRAAAAARDRDLEALWGLTEAFIARQGTKRARVSAQTLRSYRTGVVALVSAWSGENLLHPHRNAGTGWVAALESTCASVSTERVRLATGRALYNALRWSGATSADPFRDLAIASDQVAAWDPRHPYSPADLAVMLARADPETRVIVLLGAHTGLRVSEILDLQWSRVDFHRSELDVEHGKGGHRGRVLMSPTLIIALRANCDYCSNGSPWVTQRVRSTLGVRKRLAALCAAVDVPYLGVHALRHSAGTRVYKETKSLDDAARHLRHSSITSTRIYAKWSDESLRDHVTFS